jgi:DNA-directed RNA polymerase specialized sigma24 family protein
MESSEPDARSPSAADIAAVFDDFAPLVLRYAWRRLGDQDSAWDVVSDTFTSAWRHWGPTARAGRDACLALRDRP